MTAEAQRELAQLPLEQLLVTAGQAAREAREYVRPFSDTDLSRASMVRHVEHMADVIDVLRQKLQPTVAHEKNAERLHANFQAKVQPGRETLKDLGDVKLDDAGLNK